MSDDNGVDDNPAAASSESEIPRITHQGGRPKGIRPRHKVILQQRCLKQERPLMMRLIHWMKSEDPIASLTAIKLILQYGWGKPPERLLVGNDQGKPFVVASPEQVRTQEQWEKLVQESLTLDVTGEHVPNS